MNSTRRCKKDKISSKEVQVAQIRTIPLEVSLVDMCNTIPNSKIRDKMIAWCDFSDQAWNSLLFLSKWDTKMMVLWGANSASQKESLFQNALLRRSAKCLKTKISLVRLVAKKDLDKLWSMQWLKHLKELQSMFARNQAWSAAASSVTNRIWTNIKHILKFDKVVIRKQIDLFWI